MSPPPDFDEVEVARLAPGLSLALPRTPHRGRVGEVRAASAGASLELHDFRVYQPGDDLRQMDWSAVARTGELILRVRQDEVSPRLEVVLDGSRSMALSPRKAGCAREVALLTTEVGERGGLGPTLLVGGARPERVQGQVCRAALRSAAFDAGDDLHAALNRLPPLRPCGLRVVVSDFLFEAPLPALVSRLARGASALFLVQVLDAEDLEPTGGEGARLVDAESGAALEELLTEDVLAAYARRFAEHQKALGAAAMRARAAHLVAPSSQSLRSLVTGALRPLFPPAVGA
ncbi:DUF58 domain-containing protein [Melittangium boletus]|uniref:DUF58 domain-containing protein n=1 Tax=Melittangium boletus DSM 14713 TaxID=1294270 RepID=A0A250IAF4_9BACT|nr:DUF58 domain-containing protein [Melittangium boletus]ATB28745.1 hypothetical protein MEBOL_002194 [Melittangium boletus DSM 14713]